MSLHRRTSDRLSLPRRGRAAAVAATVVSAACLLLSSISLAVDAPACTVTWDGGAGNDYWDIAANWTGNRLPGESDVVCIGSGVKVELFSAFATVAALHSDSPLQIGGNLTVTGTAGTSSVSTLTLNGGRLVVDGQLDAAHVVQASGGIAGQGRITTPDMVWNGGTQGASGTTEISPGGPGLSLGGDWRSLGGTRNLRIAAGATALWTSGEFQLDGGHIDNFGLFEIRGDQDLVGCCGYGIVINEPGARIRRSSGTGDLVFAYAVANRGELDVETGRITMQGGSPPGGDSDGLFNVSRGATLQIEGSTTFAPRSRVTGQGSLVFGDGVQQVDGAIELPLVVRTGDVRLNSSQTIPRIELRGGVVQGDGRVETPDLLWTAGRFAGSGRTVVTAGGAGLTIDTPDSHGLFGRTLEVGPATDARWLDGTLDMVGSAVLENRGIFDIPGDLPAGSSGDSTALFHNAEGSVVRKSGGQGTARIPLRFRNDGIVEALSGTLSFGSLDNLNAGALQGGEWVVRATLGIGPDELGRNASALTLDGPDSRVQTDTGTDALAALSSNAEGGSLSVTGGRELTVPSSAHDFENSGALEIGADSTFRAMAAFRQSDGSTRLADATSRLAARGGQVDIQGGRLSGPGTVEGTLRNAAIVSPAATDGDPTPGVLAVTGDYVQTPAGTLEVAIASADAAGHDRVDVGGAASLAGVLRVDSLGGFLPSPNDEFELLRHAYVTGAFDRVEGLDPDPGHSYWPPEYQDRFTALRRGSVPSLSIGDVSVTEGDTGDSEARFHISVSQPPTRDIHMSWSTADGSATAPTDYEPLHGEITIPRGETSAVVTVPVHGDLAKEPDETFHVELSEATSASIATGRGTATIMNDDPEQLPPETGTPGDPPPPPPQDGGSPSPPNGGPTPPTGGGTHGPKPRPRRCSDRLAPSSAIRRPKAPRAQRRKPATLRGTARDRGCAKLRKVTIAVARRVQVRGRIRCRWMGPKGGFGRAGRCDRPRWVVVRGLAGWRLKLARPLTAGRYLARSRAVDRAGNIERKITSRGPTGTNAVSFRVR